MVRQSNNWLVHEMGEDNSVEPGCNDIIQSTHRAEHVFRRLHRFNDDGRRLLRTTCHTDGLLQVFNGDWIDTDISAEKGDGVPVPDEPCRKEGQRPDVTVIHLLILLRKYAR